MKANNLTISVPAPECNQECPFCVSKMTYGVEDNEKLFTRNVEKVKTMAKMAQVSSILITSKNEPFDNLPLVKQIIAQFSEFPVEIQTNGRKLAMCNESELLALHLCGLDVIAISVSHPFQLTDFKESGIFQRLKEIGFVIRITGVLSSTWRKIQLPEIVDICKNNGIHQLTFRLPTIPTTIRPDRKSQDTAYWIREHSKDYKHIVEALEYCVSSKNLIRRLSFGAEVYDIDGVGITMMNYCIQENSKPTELRSLIYQSDGHLYTTWDKKGSILF